jgi:tRNA nucleotidyltransferase (CCA-adding enzyme)
VYLVREIMYCRPGKVRPMVEKFKALAKLSEKLGMPKMRIMTDFCAEQFWTVVAQMEVANMQEYEKMIGPPSNATAEDMKEFDRIMQGYHDLVDHGKREI